MRRLFVIRPAGLRPVIGGLLGAIAAVVAAVAGVAPASSVQAAAGPACEGAAVAPFVDVAAKDVHAAGVDCVFSYDIARGTQIDVYDPGAAVRRDAMASFVARTIEVSNRPLERTDRGWFDDIAGNVHREHIKRLAAASVVRGREPRVYDPDGAVTRGQMTAFLVRAYEYVTGERVEASEDHFSDDDGHVHEPTINAAAELGLASGRSESRFAPNDLTHRGEMASFLSRLVDRLARDGVLEPRGAGFDARASSLPPALRDSMTGVSWEPGCPVGLDDLRFVEIVHVDFGGTRRWGQVVVHRDAAADAVEAFAAMYEDGFPVERVQRIERFDGSDDRSMEANNTSAFNCRRVSGSSSWSQHAYGTAIDINPVQNPYVKGSDVEPEEGRRYTDRDDVRPGMIVRPDAVTGVFDRLGWEWGGDWSSLKDYQHFSRDGG